MTTTNVIGVSLTGGAFVLAFLRAMWLKWTAPRRRAHVLKVQAMSPADRFRHSMVCYRYCPWREWQRTGEMP